MSDQRALLPKIDTLLDPILVEQFGRDRVLRHARRLVDDCRQRIAQGHKMDLDAIPTQLFNSLNDGLSEVINGTGVLLHTNLGRAPWGESARHAARAAQGYCNVEFDLTAGRRGKRGMAVEDRICALMKAPAALVVNNCAGAVMLMLAALAQGRSVLVSRGELVEIGGGFRVPDVMKASGADLLEVGTTNKTHLTDYQNALADDVVGVLRIHHSNFKQIGFVAQPLLSELATLPTRLLVDLGSGQLSYDAAEPSVAEAMAAGADIVCMSGDKLLGGPQSGIMIGREDAIAQIRKHPMYRALRPDKTILAALEATIDDWLRQKPTPLEQMRQLTSDELNDRVSVWCQELDTFGSVDAVRTEATIGGGSLPGQNFESVGIAIEHPQVNVLQSALLNSKPPVIGRVRNQQLIFDARAIIILQQEAMFLDAVKSALSGLNTQTGEATQTGH